MIIQFKYNDTCILYRHYSWECDLKNELEMQHIKILRIGFCTFCCFNAFAWIVCIDRKFVVV